MQFIDKGLIAYEPCMAAMEETVNAIHAGCADEQIWLLEHPSLYTAGTSARDSDLLNPRFPVYQTGRGGEYTYHGPGQRVCYVMFNLKKHFQQPDIKKYIWCLEEWIILTLRAFDIRGERREGRVGIWVVMADGSEAKIAAIGVRIRHWIAFHGIAINVNPDLSHFGGIVPCGIREHGITSMSQLQPSVSMQDVDVQLRQTFDQAFQIQSYRDKEKERLSNHV